MKSNSDAPQQNKVKSNSGYLFSPNEYYWILDKDVKIAAGSIRTLLDQEEESSFLKVLESFARTHSSSHTKNLFERLLHFTRATKCKKITAIDLINYRSTLTPETEWYLSTIRVFLKKWHKLGHPGIPDPLCQDSCRPF